MEKVGREVIKTWLTFLVSFYAHVSRRALATHPGVTDVIARETNGDFSTFPFNWKIDQTRGLSTSLLHNIAPFLFRNFTPIVLVLILPRVSSVLGPPGYHHFLINVTRRIDASCVLVGSFRDVVTRHVRDDFNVSI